MQKRHHPAVCLAAAAALLLCLASPLSAACEDYALTRADTAWFIALALVGGEEASVPDPPAGDPTFSDVTADHWAYRYIEYCAAHSIISGYSDGTFHPDDWVNRAQFAVYLARAIAGSDAAIPDPPPAPTFSDVGADHWAYRYVEYLVTAGVDAAWPDEPSLFHPDDYVMAYTASAWIEQGLGVSIDPAAIPHPLVADFAADPSDGVAPLAVQFTDTSTGHASSWAWDFGDGGSSDQPDPAHTYTAVGLYTVTLTVSNPVATDTETKPNYIDARPPAPVADFSATPTGGTIPLVVQFTDLSYQGDPDSWAWNFGDGTASTEQSPSHTYAAPGRYTVSLVAANAGGESTRTRADFILASFADVPLDHWALDAILACVDASIVQGYGDSYHPDEPVTRAQMAVYIARALAGGDALVPSGPATPHFTDVGTDHWAYRYVEYARYEGVVQGYLGGLYAPDELLNRGQMAVYIARSVVSPPGDPNVPDPAPEDPPAFPDVTADNDWAWCYKYVQYIAGLEPPVVQGYSDGTYGPGVEVTRDQMAVYVARAFDLETTVLAGEAPLGRKVVALNGLRATVEPAA